MYLKWFSIFYSKTSFTNNYARLVCRFEEIFYFNIACGFGGGSSYLTIMFESSLVFYFSMKSSNFS